MDFKFHHAALSVADMDESVAFYAELGFELVLDWSAPSGSPRICHLRLGTAMLELFWFAERQRAPETAGELATDLPRVGSKHFALQVESVRDARRFVLDRGWADAVEIVEGRTGVTYFFITDPSGILLEFVEDNRGL